MELLEKLGVENLVYSVLYYNKYHIIQENLILMGMLHMFSNNLTYLLEVLDKIFYLENNSNNNFIIKLLKLVVLILILRYFLIKIYL
jgi:hypothetical protein